MQLSISKVQQNLMFQNEIITFEYTLKTESLCLLSVCCIIFKILTCE